MLENLLKTTVGNSEKILTVPETKFCFLTLQLFST